MLKYLFFVTVLFLNSNCVFAQQGTGPTINIGQDADSSLIIATLNIATDSINSLKKLPDYAYMKNLDSLLRAQKKQPVTITSKANSAFANFALSVLQPLLWIFAALFVGYIIYRIFITRGIFKKQEKELTNIPQETGFQLEKEYQPLIMHAKEKGDFRLAARYWFLETLKNLNDKGHIIFSIDKTNNAYYFELPSAIQIPFLALTSNYEYVWYGQHLLSPSGYENLENIFLQFNHNL